MATRRMLPTRFFKDPDVMALSSGDIRLILIGLVLGADDEGRELAHAKLLGRELDYPPEVIEAALQELEDNGLLQCYAVGKYRYYSLCRWYEWQTLSKPTPSKYPAPPPMHDPSRPTLAQDCPGYSQNPLGNPGKPRETLPEGEGKRTEEEREPEPEGEEEGNPPNVVPFPTHSSSSDTFQRDDEIKEVTTQVAAILHLPVSEALTRLVVEYQADPLLSLLGEADAAVEYIDDPRRNHKRQRMSPAFFRRWLKREREDVLQRTPSHLGVLATGTAGVTHGAQLPNAAPVRFSSPAPPTSCGVDPYAAFVSRRLQEVQRGGTVSSAATGKGEA